MTRPLHHHRGPALIAARIERRAQARALEMMRAGVPHEIITDYLSTQAARLQFLSPASKKEQTK